VKEGTVAAERSALRNRAASLEQPWHGAMEPTTFSVWVYDTLAEQLETGHPAKMKAITAGKRKTILWMLAPQPIWCAATYRQAAMCSYRICGICAD
jgi:hypothetical protein